MDKLKSIITGWKNLIVGNETLSPLFKSRMSICNTCEKNVANVCIECGCFLPAKTKAPEENCPINKWKPVFYADGDFEYILREELPIELQRHFDKEEIELAEWQGFLIMNHIEEENEVDS